jgi:drug/metabolite transporter (DMT)-like permease
VAVDLPISATAARKKADAVDLSSVAVCSIVWGTTWFAITLQLGVVPPVVSVVYRFTLAAALLFAWLLLTRQPVRLTRPQHLAAMGQGVFTFALDYSLVYMAEERIPSAVVAVMFAGMAYINLVVFRVLHGQRAAKGAWIGAALGVLGVGVMSAAELVRAEMEASAVFGVSMAAAGVTAATIGNLFAHRGQQAGAPVGASVGWAMVYGTAALALYVVVSGTPWRFEPTAEYVGSLVYLAAFGSVLTFLVYFALARRRGYGFASYIGAMTPPIAMLMSVAFEGARFGWMAVAGLALVLGGQVLLMRAPR